MIRHYGKLPTAAYVLMKCKNTVHILTATPHHNSLFFSISLLDFEWQHETEKDETAKFDDGKEIHKAADDVAIYMGLPRGFVNLSMFLHHYKIYRSSLHRIKF